MGSSKEFEEVSVFEGCSGDDGREFGEFGELDDWLSVSLVYEEDE